mgnify:CR=1 FL=1
MKIPIAILLLLSSIILYALPDIRIDAETGLAIPGYNDVRIPNSGANSQFSIKNEFGLKSTLNTRLSIHYYITPKHQVSVMATPLTFKAENRLSQDLVYQNKTFMRGDTVEATYRFDSYRLQYRYNLPKSFYGIRAIGASLKLRDAEIALESKTFPHKATKTNTGFVPLLSLNAGHRVNEDLDMVLEAEGLGSPYGRAEDVFVGAVYDIKDKLSLKAGYRLLEGGSDNDEVFTFAAVHYIVLGFRIDL